METQVCQHYNEPPITIGEVVTALKKQHLNATHENAVWGDWINFPGKQTVISIESQNGLTTKATIEQAEGEDEIYSACIDAFRKLGWQGNDADGLYNL